MARKRVRASALEREKERERDFNKFGWLIYYSSHLCLSVCFTCMVFELRVVKAVGYHHYFCCRSSSLTMRRQTSVSECCVACLPMTRNA